MNLGSVYLKKEEHDKAIHFYEKSLKMKFEIYGKEANHPDIARNLLNLGFIYDYKSDYNKSI